MRLLLAASIALHAAAFAALSPPGRASAALDMSPPAIAGDTIDVEPPVSWPVQRVRKAAGCPTSGMPASAAAGPSEGSSRIASRVAARRSGPSRSRPTIATEAGRGGLASPPGLFGATGIRFAGDLATTFTRAFPQIASADPTWTVTPFGPAGTAVVTLTLDDSGHLTAHAVAGDLTPALRRGIDRTVRILEPRPFTAHAAVTRLRVAARVSPDDVHDGLHGDVFALSGGAFHGDTGTAFFALPTTRGSACGRRIDVDVRLLP